MNPTTFDTEKAKRVESAVCSEFGTTISEIVSFRDSLAKKVVVFLLLKHFGYDKRMIGHKYQMTYLYVPTVIEEITYLIKVVPGVAMKINTILKSFENEKSLDTSARRNFTAVIS